MRKNCSLYCAIQKFGYSPQYITAIHVVSGKGRADFEVDEYVFEVGGRKKGQAQIASVAQGKGFIVKDDVERAIGNIIPLWMFGFVY